MNSAIRFVPPIEVTDAVLTSSNVPDATPAVWSGATVYAVGDKVQAAHVVYEALSANTNKPPADNPAVWLELGATNRWAMFDGAVSSQTTNAAGIDVTLTPGQVVNTLGLLNLRAGAVRIRMTDPVDGLVYDVTTQLQAPPSSPTWYSYFFDPISARDYHIASLPSYGGAALRVELTGGGVTACGVLTLGRAVSVGNDSYAGAQIGAQIGIDDYSRKERDDFGNYQVVERAYSRRYSARTLIGANEVDSVAALLSAVRAKPCLWIGSPRYSSMVVYGFYKSFDIQIAYPTHSLCSLEIEGLI